MCKRRKRKGDTIGPVERASVKTLLEIEPERQGKLNDEPIEDISTKSTSIERNTNSGLSSCYNCQRISVANINIWGYHVETTI